MPLPFALCRSLAQRLDRLHNTLLDLRARLRDTVVHLVGDTVADAIRDIVRVVLAASPTTLPPPSPFDRSFRHPPRFFGEREEYGGDDELDHGLYDADPRDDDRLDGRFDPDDDNQDLVPATTHPVARHTWVDAVAAGGQAAASWLHCRPRSSWWVAAGIGAVAGIATLATGVLPGLAGAAGTALALLSVT